MSKDDKDKAAESEIREAEKKRTPEETVKEADRIYRRETGENPPGDR